MATPLTKWLTAPGRSTGVARNRRVVPAEEVLGRDELREALDRAGADGEGVRAAAKAVAVGGGDAAGDGGAESADAMGGAEEATPSPAPGSGEREGGGAQSAPADASGGGESPDATGKRKRVVKAKTQEQSDKLNALWELTEDPTQEEREALAKDLGLERKVVTKWFNSKRLRKKRKGAGGDGGATPAPRAASGASGEEGTPTGQGFATPGAAGSSPMGALDTREQRAAGAEACAAEILELDAMLDCSADAAKEAAQEAAAAAAAIEGATLQSIAAGAAEGSPLPLMGLATIVLNAAKASGLEGVGPMQVMPAIVGVADRTAVGAQPAVGTDAMADTSSSCVWRWHCKDLSQLCDASRKAQAAGARIVCAQAAARRAALAEMAEALALVMQAQAESQESQSLEAAAAVYSAEARLAKAQNMLKGTKTAASIAAKTEQVMQSAAQKQARLEELEAEKARKAAERAAKKAELDAERAAKKAALDAEREAKRAKEEAEKAKREEERLRKLKEREEKEAERRALREAKEAEKAAADEAKRAEEDRLAKAKAKQRNLMSSFFKKPAAAAVGKDSTPEGRGPAGPAGVASPSPKGERPLFVKPNEYMYTTFRPPPLASEADASTPVVLPIRNGRRTPATQWYKRRAAPGWQKIVAPARELLLYSATGSGLEETRQERRRLDSALPKDASAPAPHADGNEDDDCMMMDAAQPAGAGMESHRQAEGPRAPGVFKYLNFHMVLDEDGEWVNTNRPAYHGNRVQWETHGARLSSTAGGGPSARNPFRKHDEVDYEDYSDFEWEDEGEGEEIGSDNEMDADPADNSPAGSEVDSFIVGDDCLSEGAVDDDEDMHDCAESQETVAGPGDVPADALRLLQRYNSALARAKANGRAVVVQSGTENAHFLSAFAPRMMSPDVSIATGVDQEREVEEAEAVAEAAKAAAKAAEAAVKAAAAPPKAPKEAAKFSAEQLAMLKAFVQEQRDAGNVTMTKKKYEQEFAAMSGLPKVTVQRKLMEVLENRPGEKGFFFKESIVIGDEGLAPAAGSEDGSAAAAATPDATPKATPKATPSPAAKLAAKGTPGQGATPERTPPSGHRSIAAMFAQAASPKPSPKTPASAVAPVRFDLLQTSAPEDANGSSVVDFDEVISRADEAARTSDEPHVDEHFGVFAAETLGGEAGAIKALRARTVRSMVGRMGDPECPTNLRASLCQALYCVTVCLGDVSSKTHGTADDVKGQAQDADAAITASDLVDTPGLFDAMRTCAEANDVLSARRCLMLIGALARRSPGKAATRVLMALAEPHWLRALTAAAEKHNDGDFPTANKGAYVASALLTDEDAAGAAVTSGGSRCLLDALIAALCSVGTAAAAKAESAAARKKNVPKSTRTVAKLAMNALCGAMVHVGIPDVRPAVECARRLLSAHGLLGAPAAEQALTFANELAAADAEARLAADTDGLLAALRALEADEALGARATHAARALEKAAVPAAACT